MSKNSRGFNLIFSLLLIAGLLFWFSGTLQRMEKTCTQQEFEQLLEAGDVTGSLITQNREVPTGSAEIYLKSGEEMVLNVSDVKELTAQLSEAGINYRLQDVPADNISCPAHLLPLSADGRNFVIPHRHRQPASSPPVDCHSSH